MTKDVETPIQRFRGDGSTKAFAPGFEVFDLDDVIVELYDTSENAIGVARDGAGTYDYTVTGSFDTATDRYLAPVVTFNTAPLANYYIGLGRAGAVEQTMDLTNGASLPSESVERRFDRVVSMIQDLSEAVGRAAKSTLGLPGYFDFGGSILRNVGDPTAAQDAATRSWVLANFPTASSGGSAMKNMKDTYGAVGDGTLAGGGTDDSAAFTLAAAAGGFVYIPPGNYRITGITAGTMTQRGTRWVGAGKGQTTIIIDHTSSVGIVMEDFDQALANLTVQASTTRAALSYAENYSAIRKTKPDLVGGHSKNCVIESVEILDEPGQGIALGPSFNAGSVKYCNISNCKGNGIILDDGTHLGPGLTNKDRVGGWEIAHNVIHDNGGHWIRVGNDDSGTTQYPYRIRIYDNDAYRNATDAAVRKTTAAAWVYGENIDIRENGLGSDITSGPGAISSLWVAGRSVRVINNRYIQSAQPPVVVGNVTTGPSISTSGVLIEEAHVSGMAANADPFCEIASGARNVTVITRNEQNIDSMVNTDAPIDSEWRKADLHRWDIETLVTRLSSIQAREIADDGFTTLEFAGVNSAFALVNCETLGGKWALIWFRVGSSPYVQLIASPTAGGVAVTTGALTGTSGTDTQLTISAHTDNKLYIENRTGTALDYTVLVLANLGQDLLRSEI